MNAHALVLHGGAGAFSSARIPAVRVAQMQRDLSLALEVGAALLEGGGSALEAVVASVSVLEDSPVFNAGRGAVLRRDGSVRLDASVMCGASQRAGAVSLVRTVQNPVQLARAVLEREQEVLLCGEDADELARELGLSQQPFQYFVTEYRALQIERLWQRSPQGAAEISRDAADEESVGTTEEGQTVGAVALDRNGHLAAATSTGGTTNARPGRVGDSPILGAGTWADDATCAVSATGTGEFFLRAAFAHQVHARLAWQRVDLEAATRAALAHVAQLGGHGGCIAIDREGNLAAPFDTLAMPRAWLSRSGQRQIWVLEPDAPTDAAPADGAAGDGAASDRAASDRAASDRAASDRAASDRAASDRAASDRAASDRAASDRAASDRAASDRAASDRAASDRAASDRADRS